MLFALPALGAAVLSAGAGHGDYAAARALFPLPMLLTLVEGSIGPLAGGMALLQFPLYGALIGWSRAQRSYNPLIALACLHLAAAIACSSGLLPSFS
ncbi:MAG TPA: hypothetical protein VF650_06030 [Allosphingosinicella sp.]|jgi:hypothetical protein